MIDELAALIEKQWSTYGLTEPYERYRISFTKFCQRVVGRHTKVLFFVSYGGTPLCILKTVRASEFNENLLREAKHQAAAPRTAVLSAPKVYWTDRVGERAVYAEEYIDALPVSVSDYRTLLPHIVEFAEALPHGGTIRSDEFVSRIEHLLPDDPVIARHVETLRDAKVELELGLTHGDMGRQNILGTARRAWVIDWERSGDIPIRGFDSCDASIKAGVLVGKDMHLHYAARTAVRGLYVRLYKHYHAIYGTLVHLAL